MTSRKSTRLFSSWLKAKHLRSYRRLAPHNSLRLSSFYQYPCEIPITDLTRFRYEFNATIYTVSVNDHIAMQPDVAEGTITYSNTNNDILQCLRELWNTGKIVGGSDAAKMTLCEWASMDRCRALLLRTLLHVWPQTKIILNDERLSIVCEKINKDALHSLTDELQRIILLDKQLQEPVLSTMTMNVRPASKEEPTFEFKLETTLCIVYNEDKIDKYRCVFY